MPQRRSDTTIRRNVLRYRAFAMVLSIYYCEFVKETILATVNAQGPSTRRKTKGEARGIVEAIDVLVLDALVSPAERDELLGLMRYRNDIAHRIHQVASGVAVAPVGPHTGVMTAYANDGGALERLRFYADHIVARLERRYRVSFSMAPFLFQEARQVYEAELTRLARAIESAQ
jgi:hypothetical protein